MPVVTMPISTMPTVEMPNLAAFGPHPRLQIPHLQPIPKPGDIHKADCADYADAHFVISEIADQVEEYERTVPIWHDIYLKQYVEPLPELHENLIWTFMYKVKYYFDNGKREAFDAGHVHYCEELLYITAVRLFFLYDDIKTRLARGHLGMQTQLNEAYTTEEMIEDLMWYWNTLFSLEVLATVDFAIRKEKLLAIKTQHNKNIFLRQPNFANNYTEESIVLSMRKAMAKNPFIEGQLYPNITGLADDLVQQFRPFALAATLARNNHDELIWWANVVKEPELDANTNEVVNRIDSFELADDSDADDEMSVDDDMSIDDQSPTHPDPLDWSTETEVPEATSNSTDPFGPIFDNIFVPVNHSANDAHPKPSKRHFVHDPAAYGITSAVHPAESPLDEERPTKRARPSPPSLIINHHEQHPVNHHDSSSTALASDTNTSNDEEEDARLRGGRNMSPLPSPFWSGPRMTHPRVTAAQHAYDEEANADVMAAHRERTLRALCGEETEEDVEERAEEAKRDITEEVVRAWKGYCGH